MIDGEGGDGCSNHSGKLVSRECSIDKIELDLENFRFFEGADFFFLFPGSQSDCEILERAF